MSSEASVTAGSCLCGSVTFRVRGPFEGFFLCHCGRCRKDTGSAHAANLFASSATLDWLSGAERVKTYAVPGTRHRKSFCGECGAAVPRVEPGGALVVPAGSLDDPIAHRPDAHIFCADRAAWDERLEEVPRREAFAA